MSSAPPARSSPPAAHSPTERAVDRSLSARAASEEHPDALALVDAEGSLTWSDLHTLVRIEVDSLPPTGTPVALIGEPNRTTVVRMLAALEKRCPLVPLHPKWTESERSRVLRETNAWSVTDETPAPAAAASSAIHSDILAVVYTSGTTGFPKGALLSRRAFAASAHASAHLLPLGPGDRWLLCMPLAHVGGLSILTRCLTARAAVAIASSARPQAIAEAPEPTYLSLVPTMLARLLDTGWNPPDSVRGILLGGAACPEKLRARIAHLPVWLTYGLTEACSQVATARIDQLGAAPLPGYELRIGPDSTIRVRSPSLFDGWYPPERHPRPFDDDGFYDTGDLGELRAGRLFVHARRTDLIVSGGENVYPSEVEAVLERIDGVHAACVFGEEDPEWGERVVAAVVADASIEDATIRKHLSTSLAPFKRPKTVLRVPELVTAPSGKLDRRATRERALAGTTSREVRR